MSGIIIKAENIGKKYVIGHEAENGRYTALRDVLMQNARKLWSKTNDLVHGRPVIQGDELEEVWALKNINFEIKQGERVGIIGRNGAGKSTLLKILSRITEPSTGRVSIKGRVASLLEVGTGMHPELSGRENIYLNGAILGMSRAEIKKKFDEIVDFAGVERFLDTPVKRYSSGMYVRLAFAVAAHLEPEIFVVDEVLAVGDAQFQEKCLGKMKELNSKEGRTVLFVSHNMEAIRVLCSRAIMLRSGELADDGDVNKIVSSYLQIHKTSTYDTRKKIRLSKNLELIKFEFLPDVVVTGSSQEFIIELRSFIPFRIDAIAILLYSSLGMRVAILDLRRFASCFHLDGSTPLCIHGRIAKLPLVEGHYSAGLYIESDETRDNFLNLQHLTVLDRPERINVTPYPASVRGIVELDFTIQDE